MSRPVIVFPPWSRGIWLILGCTLAAAQQPAAPSLPAADAIMARVAANQDRAEQERTHYLYLQHARVVSRKGHTVMCEEITDTRITPSPTGSQARLLKLQGRLHKNHEYLTYTVLSPTQAQDSHSVTITLGDDETDRDLVENMRSNLLNDKSRDGLDARLFPLTTKNQPGYLFQLKGREQRNGRDVFHITFKPRQKDVYDWEGDAWIDAADYQPVVIRTDLAHKVPFAVRTLLGTNVPGLGFTVVYAPQPDGVWFPVSFGTEFKIHVLFFFTRQIIVDAENTAFQKTHTGATIVDAATIVPPR